jgi:hypothetical protein
MTFGKNAVLLSGCIIALWAVTGWAGSPPQPAANAIGARDATGAAKEQPRSSAADTADTRHAAATVAGGLRGEDLLAALANAPDDPEPEPPNRDMEPSAGPPASIVVPQTAERARLERAFTAGAPDRARGDAMRGHLVRTAAQVGIEADVVEQAECRGEICRVRLSFAGPTDAMRFQAGAQAPEFGYALVTTALQGPTAQPADPGQAPARWQVELLLSPDGTQMDELDGSEDE